MRCSFPALRAHSHTAPEAGGTPAGSLLLRGHPVRGAPRPGGSHMEPPQPVRATSRRGQAPPPHTPTSGPPRSTAARRRAGKGRGPGAMEAARAAEGEEAKWRPPPALTLRGEARPGAPLPGPVPAAPPAPGRAEARRGEPGFPRPAARPPAPPPAPALRGRSWNLASRGAPERAPSPRRRGEGWRRFPGARARRL